jgi:uncharacterized protein YwqG
LPSLHRALSIDWLPSEGRLLFFYDVESQPWGFDPKDRGSWAVIHIADGAGISSPPALTNTTPLRKLSYRAIQSIPSLQRPELAELALTDREEQIFFDIVQARFGKSAAHQVGGYPDPIQGDEMELECQLVSNGIYCGDASGYQSTRAADLASGAREWRLLLQLASDDQIDTMWGDLGNLYFWVREQDARAGRFENVWMVLQCS